MDSDFEQKFNAASDAIRSVPTAKPNGAPAYTPAPPLSEGLVQSQALLHSRLNDTVPNAPAAPAPEYPPMGQDIPDQLSRAWDSFKSLGQKIGPSFGGPISDASAKAAPQVNISGEVRSMQNR